jgi:hypothetical protein
VSPYLISESRIVEAGKILLARLAAGERIGCGLEMVLDGLNGRERIAAIGWARRAHEWRKRRRHASHFGDGIVRGQDEQR